MLHLPFRPARLSSSPVPRPNRSPRRPRTFRNAAADPGRSPMVCGRGRRRRGTPNRMNKRRGGGLAIHGSVHPALGILGRPADLLELHSAALAAAVNPLRGSGAYGALDCRRGDAEIARRSAP
jgi:hypothetical protein